MPHKTSGFLVPWHLRLITVLLVVMLWPATGSARVVCQFNYNDPPGVGFNAADPLGASRKAALDATCAILDEILFGYSATLVFDVDGAETDNATLAAASSNFNAPGAANCMPGFHRGDVGLKVLGQADPSPSADGSITVNFEDHVWDLDDHISPNAFDFKSTMLHEFIHTVGFAHSIDEVAGTDLCGNVNQGSWVIYDQFLGGTNEPFIDQDFNLLRSYFLGQVTGDFLNWLGANGRAPVPGPFDYVFLYSPDPVEAGSTLSHLDDDTYTDINYLMEAATGTGPGIRSLSAIERGILADIGIFQFRIFYSSFE